MTSNKAPRKSISNRQNGQASATIKTASETTTIGIGISSRGPKREENDPIFKLSGDPYIGSIKENSSTDSFTEPPKAAIFKPPESSAMNKSTGTVEIFGPPLVPSQINHSLNRMYIY